MTTNDAVAQRIMQLLKLKNMTQYRLEKESGVLHGAMDKILTSKNKTITLDTLYKIARGFNMTVHEFIDDDVFRSEEIEAD